MQVVFLFDFHYNWFIINYIVVCHSVIISKIYGCVIFLILLVNNDLYNYLRQYILPEYSKNDSGHGIEHIDYVVNRCLRFAEQFEGIDLNILYTAAVFHDIAHHIDKKNHEKLSAEMFRKDGKMGDFFNEEQIKLIEEAIEDHRASSEYEPRSIYGKILSSADRSIDVNDFLRRTHAYTLKHQPDSTLQEQLDRAFSHTSEKYGSDGYAKNYVFDEEYEKFKAEINNLLENPVLFEEKYKSVNEI